METFKVGGIPVEDTYAELFGGILTRLIVTADDKETLHAAAEDSTATPSVVIGRTEGGIEKYIGKRSSPDGREGAIIQIWSAAEIPNKKPDEIMKKFETELSYRIRQDILVKPFTAVYDALPNFDGKIDMMEYVGHCGDGHEWIEHRHGRKVIVVPLMTPDFVIQREIGYKKGFTGGNIWPMCKTKRAVKEAGKKALEAIHKVPRVITPFDVCSAGSKPEGQFPKIGPTTNHLYCPSLKQKLGEESKVPDGVKYIPEIVINGIYLNDVKEAMKKAIEAVVKVDGVACVSAGNYGGKLGKYKISLRELFA